MKNQAAFTLLEVMISLLVFSVVIGGMAPAFVARLKQNTLGEIRTESIAAGQIVLDQLRLKDPSTLPSSGSDAPKTITVGSRDYVVTASYCENTAYCTTINNRHITVRVTYKNVEYFKTQTVFTQLR